MVGKNKTSKYLLAGKFVLIIYLARKEQSHSCELVDWSGLAGSWEQLFLHLY